MVDAKNQTELDLMKTVIKDPESKEKYLNFDIDKLKQYIEPVLVFKERKTDKSE